MQICAWFLLSSVQYFLLKRKEEKKERICTNERGEGGGVKEGYNLVFHVDLEYEVHSSYFLRKFELQQINGLNIQISHVPGTNAALRPSLRLHYFVLFCTAAEEVQGKMQQCKFSQVAPALFCKIL